MAKIIEHKKSTVLSSEMLQEPKKKNWFRRHWIWTTVICILLLFIIIGAFNSDTSSNHNSHSLNVPSMSISDIKNDALIVSYDDLFRNNEQYVGEIVKYTGQILQSADAYGDCYVIRLATKKSDLFDSYQGDIIYVNYCGDRLLKDDIINLWGKIEGLKTYKAVLGNSVTIPEITALYTELIQKANGDNSQQMQNQDTTNTGDVWSKTSGYTLDDCLTACEKYCIQLQTDACQTTCQAIGKEGKTMDKIVNDIKNITVDC